MFSPRASSERNAAARRPNIMLPDMTLRLRPKILTWALNVTTTVIIAVFRRGRAGESPRPKFRHLYFIEQMTGGICVLRFGEALLSIPAKNHADIEQRIMATRRL